jgi:hypothetical protein
MQLVEILDAMVKKDTNAINFDNFEKIFLEPAEKSNFPVFTSNSLKTLAFDFGYLAKSGGGVCDVVSDNVLELLTKILYHTIKEAEPIVFFVVSKMAEEDSDRPQSMVHTLKKII